MSRSLYSCPTTDIISPDILEPSVEHVTRRSSANSLIPAVNGPHSCLLLFNSRSRKCFHNLPLRLTSRKILSRGIFDRDEIKNPMRDCREEPFEEETTPLPYNFRCKQEVPLNATRDPGLLDCRFTRIHSSSVGHQVALTHRFFILRIDNPSVYKTFSTGSSIDGDQRLLENDRFLDRDCRINYGKERGDNEFNHRISDHRIANYQEKIAASSGRERKRSLSRSSDEYREKRPRTSDSSSRYSSHSSDESRSRIKYRDEVTSREIRIKKRMFDVDKSRRSPVRRTRTSSHSTNSKVSQIEIVM